MTKKDFEFIAGVLAEAETRASDSKLETQLAIRGVAYMFAIELAKTHPRFNRGKFETAALPIYHRKLRNEILARMEKDQTGSEE